MASRASAQRRQTVGYFSCWPTSGTWRQQRSHLGSEVGFDIRDARTQSPFCVFGIEEQRALSIPDAIAISNISKTAPQGKVQYCSQLFLDMLHRQMSISTRLSFKRFSDFLSECE
jgi:hypothetical protein